MAKKQKTTYGWRNGAPWHDEKLAQLAGKELSKLKSRKARDILLAARPKKSPLHQFFTWDDGAAAEKYRLAEARTLASSVTMVVCVSEGGEEQETRAFVNLARTYGEQEDYHSIVKVLDDEELRDRLLKTALHDLEIWRRRYQELTELAGIFRAMDKVLKRIERRKVEK